MGRESELCELEGDSCFQPSLAAAEMSEASAEANNANKKKSG